MKSFNDHYQEFAELQRTGMAPLQQFGNLAVSAFERIARKNYEVVGDVVEFAVRQAQVPAGGSSATEAVEHQATNLRVFVEQVSTRVAEYRGIAGDIGGEMVNGVDLVSPLEAAEAATRSVVESARDAVDESLSDTSASLSAAMEHIGEGGEALARATRLATADVKQVAAGKSTASGSKGSSTGSQRSGARSSSASATGKRTSKTTNASSSKPDGVGVAAKAAPRTTRKAASKATPKAATGTARKPAATTRKRATTARKKKTA